MTAIEDMHQYASRMAMQALDQGRVAFAEGRKESTNPYASLDEFYRQSAWRRGWNEARTQSAMPPLVRAA